MKEKSEERLNFVFENFSFSFFENQTKAGEFLKNSLYFHLFHPVSNGA